MSCNSVEYTMHPRVIEDLVACVIQLFFFLPVDCQY